MIKVSIIGTGSVGSTIAYSLAIMGVASEIVLIDINQRKGAGRGAGYPPGNAVLRRLLGLCGDL